jgi:hypothetical protein
VDKSDVMQTTLALFTDRILKVKIADIVLEIRSYRFTLECIAMCVPLSTFADSW